MELDDTATHECMRGQGVGAVAAAVQHEYVEPGPSQEHGGGGTGGARTDDDDVVAGGGLFHGVVLSVQLRTLGPAAAGLR